MQLFHLNFSIHFPIHRSAIILLLFITGCSEQPTTSSSTPTPIPSTTTTPSTSPKPPSFPTYQLPVPFANSELIVNRINQFAFDLYRQLNDHEGNVWFSPYSLFASLSIPYTAASGSTKTQLAKILQASNETELSNQLILLKNFLQNRQTSSYYKLRTVQALWGQKGYAFSSTFLKTYPQLIQTVNFMGDVGSIRKTVNQWIAQQTDSKINNFLPSHAIQPLTRLLLTDAIYFEGDWQKPFNSNATQKLPFTIAGEITQSISTLRQSNQFGYWENSQAQFLELPYLNSGLALLVILPNSDNNLKTIEKQFSISTFNQWVSSLKEQTVDVYLPKFQEQTTYQMQRYLEKLGITEAFNQKANFSKLDSKKVLRLSGILHQAQFKIHEQGSRATSGGTSTVQAMTNTANFSFKVNRPFFVFIRDQASKTILFMGRIADPSVNQTAG